jgi:predicted esterase
VDALTAALQDARKRPGVDQSRLLVAGHSEGALLTCEVAARHPNQVTHIAPFSAGGVTQLYSLLELARAKSDADVAKVVEGWRNVQKDPDSYQKSWFGHTYLRWSSFLRSSCMQRLGDAPTTLVYLAHGTKDAASAIQATDALWAWLLAQCRPVVYERLEAADHGLQLEAEPERNGLAEVFARLVDWYVSL